MQDLLQKGIWLARAGRREEARAVLMQVVEADERSEQGWLWLSGVMDDPEDIRTCLENVLDLNPQSAQARQGLEWLTARYGPPAAAQPPEQPAASAYAPPLEAPPEPSVRAAPVGEARPTPAQPALPEKLMQAAQVDAAEPDNPCPYCGAPTSLAQKTCLRCRRSLMVRDQPRERRSLALTILGWLWYISGGLTLLGSLAIFGVAVFAYQAGQQSGQSGAGVSAAITIATVAFITLLFGGAYIAVARGLLQRARWAYYVVIALAVLGLIGALINVASGAALIAVSNTEALGLPPGGARDLGRATGAVLACTLILQALYLLLIGLSYRDFFGPMLRFQPSFMGADHATHYNNGVAYKDRGMWYMAMREWESATGRAPNDLNYLHALGLAYAQVGRFDRARATLDRALDIAPAHSQIRESRALVEKMAADARK